ncbi:hypothetical protein L3X38_031416 [Prunus dulcis]|uniref:Uncharacterized protein n=1 Tax=Prunus dulcis TaxID=3755 RepID=A0AAD4YV28_PRUDU|nr:hypothetical protein L3X38_031416 [Prunus dulcis]
MSGSGGSEVRSPIFSGENYEFWRIKMITIFKSYGLWAQVEKRITIPESKKNKAAEETSTEEDDEKMAAILVKDAKALGIIQNSVSDQIFPRIANADSAKMAWNLLYGEYHGGDHVRSVKLQNLRLDLQEVIAILKSQEHRFELRNTDTAEKAFASFSMNPKSQNKGGYQSGQSKSQKNWSPKGKPWESNSKPQHTNFAQNSSSTVGQEGSKPQCKVCSKFHFGECRYKGKPKCYNCDKFGHLARECTAGKNVQKANYANQMEVTGNLFYANSTIVATNVTGEWYIDSGCSNHMIGNGSLLIDIRTNVVGKVQMPNCELVNVAGMGTLAIDTTKGRKYIKEVMYLPGLKENLLSVGQMDEHGYYLVFGGKLCSIFEGPSLECLVIKVEMKRNRCYPLALLPTDHIALKASVSNSTWTWHKRLGHLHLKGLSQPKEKNMVHGLPFMEKVDGVCDGCQFGKRHREWFPKNQAWRASNPLELVHVDLCGPMQNESIAGNKYVMLLIDDCTRMVWVYFLRYKSDALNCFRKFKSMVELQSGLKVKCLRSDKGGEFTSCEFNKLCEVEGIQRQLSMAYTPQQNGVVERKNRIVVEMAKAMLHGKGLPYYLWAELCIQLST